MSILVSKKTYLLYLAFSVFTLIFGMIYEHFSHGVYSLYMMYAFIIPLVFGFIVTYILNVLDIKISLLSLNFYHSLIVTMTLGSIVNGFLEIYGTTNNLIYVYIYASIMLLILTILTSILKKA